MNTKDKEFLMVGGIGALYGAVAIAMLAMATISLWTLVPFVLGALIPYVWYNYDKPIHQKYDY
jgi:hypothetical protein